MNRVSAIIFMIGIGIILCLSEGCTGEISAGGNHVMDAQMIAQYQKAMHEDINGDEKSVFFEDGKIDIKEDILDSPEALGEYGFGALEHIERSGWSVEAPLTGEISALVDDENHCILKADNRIMDVSAINFNEMERALDAEAGMEFVPESAGPYSHLAERYKRVKIYSGIREYDEQIVAGYVMIFEDLFDHEYQVGWFGTGNMSWIGSDASQVFHSFAVQFDVDQWLAERDR